MARLFLDQIQLEKEVEKLKCELAQVVTYMKKLKTRAGTPLEECKKSLMKTYADGDPVSEYNRLDRKKKYFRRSINTLQYRVKNATYATRNFIMNKALKKGSKEGFQMVRDTIKPKRKKGENLYQRL